jgi:hypothetical protein
MSSPISAMIVRVLSARTAIAVPAPSDPRLNPEDAGREAAA